MPCDIPGMRIWGILFLEISHGMGDLFKGVGFVEGGSGI